MPSGVYERNEKHREIARQACVGRTQSQDHIDKRADAMRGKTRDTYTVTENVLSARQRRSESLKQQDSVYCTNGCGQLCRPAGLTKHLKRCVGFTCSIEDCTRTDHGAQLLCGFHYSILKGVRRHGLTIESYFSMYASQDGKCAICSKNGLHRGHGSKNADKAQVLHIDHDHITGKVRGLVCHACNIALGMMQDSPSRLRAAADYLENN